VQAKYIESLSCKTNPSFSFFFRWYIWNFMFQSTRVSLKVFLKYFGWIHIRIYVLFYVSRNSKTFSILSNWTYSGFNVSRDIFNRTFLTWSGVTEKVMAIKQYDSFVSSNGTIITIPLKSLNLRKLIKIEESSVRWSRLLPVEIHRKWNEDSICFAKSLKWRTRDLL